MLSTNVPTDMLRLRVSEGEKDESWYRFQRDRMVPAHAALRVEDYEEMDRLYKFINNDLTAFRREVAYYCGDLTEFGATEEELVPYNPVPNKFEVLKGDMLSRGMNHRIMLMTAKAVRRKNEELLRAIESSVNQELAIAVQQQRMQLQGMAPQEIEQYIQQMRTHLQPQDIRHKDFLSEAEVIFSKLLQHGYHTQGVQMKKVETLEDILAVSRLFLYCGWEYGRPVVLVINPKNLGFLKNPELPFIQKGDYVFHVDEITVVDTLQAYINDLPEADLRKLVNYGHSINSIGPEHMTRPISDNTRFHSLLEHVGDILRRGDGTHQGNQLHSHNLLSTLFRSHLEFKAFREIIFLTVPDEYGEKITFTVDGASDIIPRGASRIKFTNRFFEESHKYVWTDAGGVEMEAERMWIPRRYELTDLGSDVITTFREVPFQPDYGDNPFSRFELSYKGCLLMNRNAKWISPLQRAMPTVFQYMAVKRIQDREIASYVGQEKVVDVDQIPDEVGADHEMNPEMSQDPTLKNEVIARKTKTRFTSGSRHAHGLPPPPTRAAGVIYNVVDTSPQLLNLQALAQQLDIEAGMRLGIPPSRESAVIPNTNVGDNRQSLVQSTLATQTIFYTLDAVWGQALNEYLTGMVTYLRNYFASNPLSKRYEMEYILPDGTREFFSVLPEQVEALEDLGLYLFDNGKEQLYFQTMLNSVFSFAQNSREAAQGAEAVSSVMKALTRTNSIEEAHKIIAMQADKVRERIGEEQAAQQQMLQQQKEMMTELERYRAELKLEGDLRRIQEQRLTAIEQAKIQSESLAKQFDINQNKESDLVERDREQREFQGAENEKDRKLEREKIASQERISKARKPTGQ